MYAFSLAINYSHQNCKELNHEKFHFKKTKWNITFFFDDSTYEVHFLSWTTGKKIPHILIEMHRYYAYMPIEITQYSTDSDCQLHFPESGIDRTWILLHKAATCLIQIVFYNICIIISKLIFRYQPVTSP